MGQLIFKFHYNDEVRVTSGFFTGSVGKVISWHTAPRQKPSEEDDIEYDVSIAGKDYDIAFRENQLEAYITPTNGGSK